jgi:HD-like signal output (HDOD) protein
MPVDPKLRSLNIDVPAQPESLVKLSLLLADEDVNLQSISGLINSDMALASAVLKAVNSSLYGLAGRVQSACSRRSPTWARARWPRSPSRWA